MTLVMMRYFFKRLFEKTGCLLTADGPDDVKISPQI